jgi:lipopolysaccharide biosynthesis glycosyltransferase
MATSMISLFESNRDIEEIVVYCLLYHSNSIDIENLKQIGSRYKREVKIVSIDDYCIKHRFWESNEDSRYIRLLLPLLIPEPVVLYLDCDIAIKGSLRELFSIDISQYYHASVLDTVRRNAREESCIKDYNRYFNSGVMLINLDRWRVDNLVEKFRVFKTLHNNKGIYRDQRVLNGTTAECYLTLHPKYNFTPELYRMKAEQIKKVSSLSIYYTQRELDEAIKNPIIIHYAGRSIDRPWYDNCEHPFKTYYRDMMLKFPYTNVPLKRDSMRNILKWKIKSKLPFFILYLFIK